MVGFSVHDCLDEILSKTKITNNFDLLSIDIDGDDYHVWEAMDRYQPKVVIIEINIRDKPDITRINVTGTPVRWGITGTSIKSMVELGEKKDIN